MRRIGKLCTTIIMNDKVFEGLYIDSDVVANITVVIDKEVLKDYI